MSAARRRAIDRVRASTRQRRIVRASAHELEPVDEPDGGAGLIDDAHDDPDADERLRLMLLCCHPALDRDAQVALTLRLVAGLTVGEISRAFVVPEATLAQRIVRAKRKIRSANIPLSMPTELRDRLDVLLAVLYLVFNEGYLSHDAAADPIRGELVDEAVRLTQLVVESAPDEVEPLGLLALQRFHLARSDSRLDSNGELVLLADQDRSTWRMDEIRRANELLGRALAAMCPGRFQIEAMIAGAHANAPTAADTDWSRIVALYTHLLAMTRSPVVALNRAAAVAEADGPLAGLAALEDVDGLDRYHLYWATIGELERRTGRKEEARSALARAAELVTNPAERRLIERRLSLC